MAAAHLPSPPPSVTGMSGRLPGHFLVGQQQRGEVVAQASRSFASRERRRVVVSESEESEEEVQQQQQQQGQPLQESSAQQQPQQTPPQPPKSQSSKKPKLSLQEQLLQKQEEWQKQLQQKLKGEEPEAKPSTEKPPFKAEAPNAAEAAVEAARSDTNTVGKEVADALAEDAERQGLEEAAAAAPAPETEMVTEVYSEEIIVFDKPITVQSIATDTVQFVRTTNVGKAAAVAAGALVVSSFVLACHRYWQNYQSARSQRLRQVGRNKLLVQELTKVLTEDRAKLTPGFVKGVQGRTGFTMVEVFRKYLWYLLRERKFDQVAVDDLVALKHAAGLTDADVAEALRERAQRTYEKYGTLMLNTEGMTTAGIERKAGCQALFRKLLFLTEYEPIIKQGTEAATTVDLKRIFGATEEDTQGMRIVSLYDVDLEKAFGMTVSMGDEDDDEIVKLPPGYDSGSSPSSSKKKKRK